MPRKLLSDINVYIKLDMAQAAPRQSDLSIGLDERAAELVFGVSVFAFCQSKFSIVATLSYSYGENVLYRVN